MVRLRLIRLALTMAVAGCATFRPGEDNPARSLEAGLQALEAADFGTAQGHLDRAGLAPESGEAGRRALLLGTLARLDPRNPDRDFDTAAGRATQLRTTLGATAWEVLASRTLAGLANELATTRERVRQAELERQAAVAATVLATESGNARIQAVTADRDAARRRVTQLEQTLAEKEKELREKTQELERIRRAIRG